MDTEKRCKFCGKDLTGITPVELYRKSRFSFLRFHVASFCSQECEDKYLKMKEEKALVSEAVDLAEELSALSSELSVISQRLSGYFSMPQDAKDPAQLAEIKGELASLNKPDVSELKGIAKKLREADPDNPEVLEAAKELENLNASYKVPGWTEDTPGLAEQCSTASALIMRIADKIDSINFPKEEQGVNTEDR